MDQDAEKVMMERIDYHPGTGDRFVLLVFTKDTHQATRRYGGDPVSPLYGPQARRLLKQERGRGFLTQLIRHRPDGRRTIESDF